MYRRTGFTLIELLVVIAIIAMLIAILLPSLSRAREVSKQAICGTHLKSIGNACEMYSNDNRGKWPIPPHAKVTWEDDADSILWWATMGYAETRLNLYSDTPFKRQEARHVSVSRAIWQLIRETRIDNKVVICPSSPDTPDPLEVLDRGGTTIHSPDYFYDFQGYRNLSYAYQVPFGPGDVNLSRASHKADSRLVVLADKGPFNREEQKLIGQYPTYYLYQDRLRVEREDPPYVESDEKQVLEYVFNRHDKNGALIPLSKLRPVPPHDSTSGGVFYQAQYWRPGNSPNHGGAGNGEGQNCYRIDGSSKFEKKPCAGIDYDNIYTKQEYLSGGNEVYTGLAGPFHGVVQQKPPGFQCVALLPDLPPNQRTHGTTDSYVWP